MGVRDLRAQHSAFQLRHVVRGYTVETEVRHDEQAAGGNERDVGGLPIELPQKPDFAARVHMEDPAAGDVADHVSTAAVRFEATRRPGRLSPRKCDSETSRRSIRLRPLPSRRRSGISRRRF